MILSPAFPASESETVWVRPKQLFVRKLQEHFPYLNIIILAFNYPLHNQQYLWRGIKVISFNGLHNRKLKRLLLWVKVWRKLRKLHSIHRNMDILSFWCGECALIGRHFAAQNNLRHLTWISGMDAKKENKLIKLIRPREKELVSMSVFLQKQFFKNHHLKPAHTIPIGIDCCEFGLTNCDRDIDILGVGTLNPFKQYDIFIDVIKNVSDSFPGIKAVICGEGTDRDRLQKLIISKGLEKNISLAGLVPHQEVLGMMQRSKIFLHPSSYEGFGAVCLEALYAGAEVVSFCNPMELQVDRWHIVEESSQMKQKVLELLRESKWEQSRVLLYSMDDTVKAMMKLFDESKSHASNPRL